MNMQHLKYVLEVNKTRSINKAAKNLYMGQPNLSAAIKDLEEEIGVSIFYRTKKGVQLTREGEKFLAKAAKIISQVNELESFYKTSSKSLVFLSIAAHRATYITIAISKFINNLENKKDMNITFNETNSLNVINEVASGNAEIGIIRYQNIHESYFLSLLESKDIVFEPLWEFQMLITFSESHPLAPLEKIPFEMLADYIEIVSGDTKIPTVKDFETPASSKCIYVYDRGSHINLLTNVKGAFMWVPMLPEHILKRNHLVQKICTIPSIITRDILIHSAERVKSNYAQDFILTLHDIIKNMPDSDNEFFL